MAKKKAKVETDILETAEASEIELPAERVYKAGGKAVIAEEGRWHILYTPLWRAQIDFGEFEGAIDVPLFVPPLLSEFTGVDTPPLNWQQESETVWIATGDDGVGGDTNLPIVRVTKVG